MAEKRERKALKRGLSALMADVAPTPPAGEEPARSADIVVPVDQISPNPDQPRRIFQPGALEELASSIREKGIIQPLILRRDPADEGRFQIVAGERRWRAAQMAQVHAVPAIIREFDDTEVLEIAIIENIQRADLNAMEEAAGYRQLMERFGHTQERLAEALGKSRSHIANTMRLLDLPMEIQTLVQDGKLTAGHARALITAEDPLGLAGLIVRKGLSVREAERLAKKPKASAPKPAAPQKDADTRALESDLSAALSMGVSIDHTPGEEAGRITIRYKTLDDLDELCRRLTAQGE
ncbi:ParB/RepB/Spo0J family partition protein [Ovoidimarina sediminis]|uniref:ParB/RepB/Spo0J family partition protein n=1 Tax=Ovoidimarina sediminis TaxID=3079856 RepID=UPI00290C5A18|nr:ParB/RepB/Spo0J family partition protein [Rhodophyticola sp. MJ-SS7]MDU8942540.1 ParB/RepB/Spo0J family partition protein [Rhodophyticola sp. MJ-SS7]